jgi:hypothetical protein
MATAVWLIAATVVLQLFLTVDRGASVRTAGHQVSNLLSTLHTTHKPASAHDTRQPIGADDGAPGLRSNHDPQDEAGNALAPWPPLSVLSGKVSSPAIDYSSIVRPRRTRPFDPRGPPIA